MGKPRRQFNREFKVRVVREVEAGKGVAAAAREHDIHPNLIGKWQKDLAKYAAEAFSGNGRAYKEEAKVAELERLVGRLTAENEFLKKVLERCE